MFNVLAFVAYVGLLFYLFALDLVPVRPGTFIFIVSLDMTTLLSVLYVILR